MNCDDPKITAYALGEGDEEIFLDSDGERIVEETKFVAAILGNNLKRRRRRVRLVRVAVAVCLMMAAGWMWMLMNRSPSGEMVAKANVERPARKSVKEEAILHLRPRVEDGRRESSLANAEFKGDRAADVQELVAAVLEDASRVGRFRELSLRPESPVTFQ